MKLALEMSQCQEGGGVLGGRWSARREVECQERRGVPGGRWSERREVECQDRGVVPGGRFVVLVFAQDSFITL